MRDIGEYLRAYRAYISASHGWAKAVIVALVWIAGMFVPLAARTFVQLPTGLAITLLGYVFAPYGMWKHHRAQIANSNQPDRK
jgi:hypothetical protein